MTALPEITEIKRLEIRPGDRLILRTSGYEVGQEEAAEIRHRVRATLGLPAEMPILVLGSNWDAEVLGGGEPGG